MLKIGQTAAAKPTRLIGPIDQWIVVAQVHEHPIAKTAMAAAKPPKRQTTARARSVVLSMPRF